MGKKKRAKASKKAGWTPQGQATFTGWGGNGNPTALAKQGGVWPAFLGKRPSDQFLMGALLGAAAAYLLGDEKLRGKLIKGGLQLYSSIAGGMEEMKEQMADIRAEMAAGPREAE